MFLNNQLLDIFIRGLNHEDIYNNSDIRGITNEVVDNAIQLEDNLMIKGCKVSCETKYVASLVAIEKIPMTIKCVIKETAIQNLHQVYHHNHHPQGSHLLINSTMR